MTAMDCGAQKDSLCLIKPRTLYSSKELEAVQELRKRVEGICEDKDELLKLGSNFYLNHWLRAQKFNVNKAESMIREAVKWKHEKHLNQLLEAGPDPLISELLPFKTGVTKEGYPVTHFDFDNFQIRKATSEYGAEAVSSWLLYQLATIEDHILKARIVLEAKQQGGPLEEMNEKSFADFWFLVDVTSVTLWDATSPGVISVAITCFRTMVRYFPTLTGKLCFLNANRFFYTGFKIVAPILSGSNLEILIFGREEKQWRACLMGSMEEDEINKFSGGKRKFK